MRFKVDENLPVEVAELLSSAGHDALTVFDQSLGGEHDRRILNQKSRCWYTRLYENADKQGAILSGECTKLLPSGLDRKNQFDLGSVIQYSSAA